MHSHLKIGLFLWLFSSVGLFAQNTPEPLPPLDSLNYSQMWTIGSNLFHLADMVNAKAKESTASAGKTLDDATLVLANAKADSTFDKTRLDSLVKLEKAARDTYKKAEKLQKQSEKVWNLSGALTSMDSVMLRKNLPKVWTQVKKACEEVFPEPKPEPVNTEVKKAKIRGERDSTAQKALEETPKAPVKKDAPAPLIRKYNAAEDVMMNPPPLPCVIASSSKDEFSGEISRQMAAAEMFRYTNPALKNYLQGKTHIICSAALLQSGASVTLLLNFTINDPNARKAFGRIDKNSLAILKFMDGSSFNLYSSAADDGTYVPENGATVFQARYALNAEAVKKMRKTELDKLRIAWSNGYDDYDIQQVDVLLQQATCLFGK